MSWPNPLRWIRGRIALSRAKHRSLAGHPWMARNLARVLPRVSYDEDKVFSADQAPPEVAKKRKVSFEGLAEAVLNGSPTSVAITRLLREGIADLEFIHTYRVPFPFAQYVRSRMEVPSVLARSKGPVVTDLDGNDRFDLSGSYGVNLFGYEHYKGCIERASTRARELGPLLGAYHPCVEENVRRLQAISGLEQVSFHMSGTEAVMQAVRLARYHTGRPKIVRFAGAYHGWWDDVQPGPGTPVVPRHTFTLAEMSEATLEALELRDDVACVLINPLQALAPNRPASGDSTLVDSSRSAAFDKQAYIEWLQRLRALCTRKKVVLIMDEVFMGFRLGVGGAQAYFDVKADLVTYGKTLGGGLPVGVLCGRADLMRRYREDRPGDICFARGTFNAHPYVMAAMYELLHSLDTPEVQAQYEGLHDRWDARAKALNQRLDAAGHPLQVANLSTVWTFLYTRASRYNWMLQYYLRDEGLSLSWVGSGRLIFSLDYDEATFSEVADRIMRAAARMEADGWWWQSPLTNQAIRRSVLREAARQWFSTWSRG